MIMKLRAGGSGTLTHVSVFSTQFYDQRSQYSRTSRCSSLLKDTVKVTSPKVFQSFSLINHGSNLEQIILQKKWTRILHEPEKWTGVLNEPKKWTWILIERFAVARPPTYECSTARRQKPVRRWPIMLMFVDKITVICCFQMSCHVCISLWSFFSVSFLSSFQKSHFWSSFRVYVSACCFSS